MLAVFCGPAVATGLNDAASPTAVEAFGAVLADLKNAEERCLGTHIDWSAVASWKERLRVPQIDYPSFHKQTQSFTERLGTEGDAKAWCEDVYNRYGPQGRSLANTLWR